LGLHPKKWAVFLKKQEKPKNTTLEVTRPGHVIKKQAFSPLLRKRLFCKTFMNRLLHFVWAWGKIALETQKRQAARCWEHPAALYE